jgi:hypothetical protein
MELDVDVDLHAMVEDTGRTRGAGAAVQNDTKKPLQITTRIHNSTFSKKKHTRAGRTQCDRISVAAGAWVPRSGRRRRRIIWQSRFAAFVLSTSVLIVAKRYGRDFEALTFLFGLWRRDGITAAAAALRIVAHSE